MPLVTMDRHASPRTIHLLTLLKTDTHFTERLGDADTGSKAACVSVPPPSGLEGRTGISQIKVHRQNNNGAGNRPLAAFKIM